MSNFKISGATSEAFAENCKQGVVSDMGLVVQAAINAGWVGYDKYDRNTWPQIQDGSRLALCEDEEGNIHISTFYGDDEPDWGAKTIDDDIKIIRYTDIATFRYLPDIKEVKKCKL